MLFSKLQTITLHEALTSYIKSINDTFKEDPKKRKALSFLEDELSIAIDIRHNCERWCLIEDRVFTKEELWTMLRAVCYYESVTYYDTCWHDKDTLYGEYLNDLYTNCIRLKDAIDNEYHEVIREEMMK